MVTISRIVEKIIEENAFLEEALSRKIINYVALAEEIKPRIDRELKENAKISAIMMALRRLQEKLGNKFARKAKFSKDSEIFIKSDLFEITVKKSSKTFSVIQEIYPIIDPERDFLTITQGITQVTIIANRRNKEKILKILHKEKIYKELDDLACLSTTIPMNAIDEAGYFYIITRAFAWEDIALIEIVSTLTELNLIIKEKDVPKAFILFKDTIKNNS
ncbi:MAG: hypothetical protein Q8Q31_04905 [Nanoarchaeota archaeon]|nr:hypothetical protein [Nanoarchaeota archaeon]